MKIFWIILLFVLNIQFVISDPCLPDIAGSLNVWGNNLSVCFNGSVLRTTNITSIREGNYQLSNFTSHFANRLGELWNLLNLTNFLGGGNNTIVRFTNISGY